MMARFIRGDALSIGENDEMAKTITTIDRAMSSSCWPFFVIETKVTTHIDSSSPKSAYYHGL